MGLASEVVVLPSLQRRVVQLIFAARKQREPLVVHYMGGLLMERPVLVCLALMMVIVLSEAQAGSALGEVLLPNGWTS